MHRDSRAPVRGTLRAMSEQDPAHRGEAKSEADQTLLGVAPPRIDRSADQLPRAPVYVRSGTSIADIESPLSRAARSAQISSENPVSLPNGGPSSAFERGLVVAKRRPVLWMVLTPLVLSSLVLALAYHPQPARTRVAPASGASSASSASRPLPATAAAASPSEPRAALSSAELAALEAKPPASLSAREVLLLAEAHSDKQRAAARELRAKVERDPALAKDKSVPAELTRLAAIEGTSRDALAAMAALEAPAGADLLYESWTGTPQRSDTTELARALVYSPDVRPKASPALAVALDLRAAETCEQFKAILPNALKDGDRRSLHLLLKLNAKRGCGPKKADDCYACLRESKDELTATINAVKSRRPPSYAQ